MTNKIYVPNRDSNDVTVIDGATNKTTAVAAGSIPFAVAINPVTNKIYVVNGDFGGSITVIDGATNATATIPAGEYPRVVAVNSATNKIYFINRSDNLMIIDGATNTTTSVPARAR